MKTKYIWVIRTKSREGGIWRDRYDYSARQTSYKNKSHLSCLFYQARFFASKDEAWEYFYKKVRSNVNMSNCTVVRKKIWIGKDGYLEFWKNTKSFR